MNERSNGQTDAIDRAAMSRMDDEGPTPVDQFEARQKRLFARNGVTGRSRLPVIGKDTAEDSLRVVRTQQPGRSLNGGQASPKR